MKSTDQNLCFFLCIYSVNPFPLFVTPTFPSTSSGDVKIEFFMIPLNGFFAVYINRISFIMLIMLFIHDKITLY